MRTSIAVYELRSIQDRLARIAEKCGQLANELRTVEANLDARIGLAIESLPTASDIFNEPSDLPTPWIDTTGLELELDVEGK